MAGLLAVLAVGGLYAAIAFITFIPTILKFITDNIALIALLVLACVVILNILEKLDQWIDKGFELVPVTGFLDHWLDDRFSSQKIIQSDRKHLYLAMNTIHGEVTSRDDLPTKADLLTEDIPSIEAPLAPGITELALAMQGESVNEIREHLKRIRSFHHKMAIATVAAFFLSVSFGLYATVFLQSDVYKTAFGGAGLGVVLAAFAFLTLRNERISQISLALFESYVAELRVTLTEAESLKNRKEKLALRNIAWQQFRIGLNSLWDRERKREQK